MKTFSQLKRDITVGTTIKTIFNLYRPDKNGQIRKINKVQTNAIGFEIPEEQRTRNVFGEIQDTSWLWWGKASQYEYEDNTFKIYETIKNERVLAFVYEILRG